MKTTGRFLAVVLAQVATAGAAAAASANGFTLTVLVDGRVRPEYLHRGTTYIEALRGREYLLRLTNPTPRRVAVALAVDGLNTIDARHTDPQSAAKWVLEPYGSVEIAGWQVSGREARRFFFTTERSSYGAWLGATDNLGVIEAVFFAEREAVVPILGGGEPPRLHRESAKAEAPQGVFDLAATGIGERIDHPVRRVRFDLEPTPAAVVRIRYEFRPQLAALGVLPPLGHGDALERRERARGFAGSYCPDPGRSW